MKLKNIVKQLLGQKSIDQINKVRKLIRKNKLLVNVKKTNYSQSALVVYITAPFYSENQYMHQNFATVKYMVEALSELKFNVDIVDCFDDKLSIDYNKYDLIFGFGYHFEQSFLSKTKAKRVFLVTGVHLELQNNMCIRAIKDAELIFGKKFFNDSHVLPKINYYSHYFSDMVLILADGFVKSDYEKRFCSAVHTLNNNAITIFKDITPKHYFNRKNILIVCGTFLIKKGIHLVIQFIKKHSEFNYTIIYASSSNEFKLILDELSNLRYVTIYQNIPMNSIEFRNAIINNCMLLSPSYADGMPGAVIEPMIAGIIPIVSKYCGFPENNIFVTIDNLDLDSIERSIAFLLSLTDSQFAELRKKVKTYALQEYNVEYCKKQFTSLISEGLQL